ncbi:MAG: class I SAM-dependent methyltransferase [bacterium]
MARVHSPVMATRFLTPAVTTRLRELHQEATDEFARFRDSEDKHLDEMYLAVPYDTGMFLHITAKAMRAEKILEVGSSKGLSTLWLAGALKEQGRGKLIGTELIEAKWQHANRLLEEFGLTDYAEIRLGDAFEVIPKLQGPYDLAFLDAWKPDYLRLYQTFKPLLRHGGLVIADNMISAHERTREFKGYLDDSVQVDTVTLPIGSGEEYCYIFESGNAG